MSRPYASSNVKRECLRIRGGWMGGLGPRQEPRKRRRVSWTLKAKESDDDGADVRGGAVARKVRNSTDRLATVSGPITLQVSNVPTQMRVI